MEFSFPIFYVQKILIWFQYSQHRRQIIEIYTILESILILFLDNWKGNALYPRKLKLAMASPFPEADQMDYVAGPFHANHTDCRGKKTAYFSSHGVMLSFLDETCIFIGGNSTVEEKEPRSNVVRILSDAVTQWRCPSLSLSICLSLHHTSTQQKCSLRWLRCDISLQRLNLFRRQIKI